jgi:hypothetical protein
LELPLWLFYKKHYKHIILIPDYITMENETREDFDNFRKLYDFQITYRNKKYRYSDYVTGGENFTESAPIYGTEEENDIPIFRRNDSNKPNIKKIIESIHQQGANVLAIPDECHYGTHCEGVLADIFDFCNPNDRIIASSATPFNLAGLEQFKVVNCRTYPEYIGYSFADGEYLDPRYPAKTPQLIPLNDPNFNHELPFLANLDRAAYKNINTFKKTVHAQSMSHAFYRYLFEDTLKSLWKYCLLKNNKNDSRGFICRAFLTNSEIDDFIQEHQADLYNVGIRLVGWKDDKAKMSLSECLQEQNVGFNDYKVILVSGGARMGIRLDDRHAIYYSADLSATSNLTAVIQGLLGRQSGCKTEPPIGFVTPTVKEMMDLHVDSLGNSYIKAPHLRTRILGDFFNKDRQSIKLWRTPKEGNGFALADYNLHHIGDFLQEFTSLYQNGKTLKRGRMPSYFKNMFWDQWNKFLPEIEHAINLPQNTLLRYHPDTVLEKPFIDDHGLMYDGTIGFRTMGAGGEDNSPVNAADRLANGMKKHTIRRLTPQTQIRFHRGKCIAHSIKISLVSAKTITGHQIVLPKENDLGYQWIDSQESGEHKYVA